MPDRIHVGPQSQSYIEQAVTIDIATAGQKNAGVAAKIVHKPRRPWKTTAAMAVAEATISAIIDTMTVKDKRIRPRL
jgi:hypothetical protein